LLLLNHVKRLDQFEQLPYSALFAVYESKRCLFFCISAKASQQFMLLSGCCTTYPGWRQLKWGCA